MLKNEVVEGVACRGLNDLKLDKDLGMFELPNLGPNCGIAQATEAKRSTLVNEFILNLW